MEYGIQEMFLLNVHGISLRDMLKTKEFQNLTFYYRANSADEQVLDHSFENDIFYSELTDFHEESRMTIIDVGAHIGTFSILSALKYQDSKIISLEPNPHSYSILCKNIESNHIQNVIPVQAAVNYKPGPTKLFLSNENWEHSITTDFGASHLEVQGITIAQIFDKYTIQSCDLLKMNCEGAEFNIVLHLPSKVLSKIKMMLILFHEDLITQNVNRKTLISYLRQNGFLVRKSQMRKERGWIIARNKDFYHEKLADGIIRNLWSTLIHRK